MSEIQNQIKKWPVTAIKKIKSTFGSAEKFYENLEQNNLFDSPDEDENMGMGGMSL
jgi:hypothetical protein